MKNKLALEWHKDIVFPYGSPKRVRFLMSLFVGGLGFQFSVWADLRNSWYFTLWYNNKELLGIL